MGDTGFEDIDISPKKATIPHQGVAESGAVRTDNSKIDPKLAIIIAAWPHLALKDRSKLLELVKEAKPAVK